MSPMWVPTPERKQKQEGGAGDDDGPLLLGLLSLRQDNSTR
jgi:hypothetical protein